MFFFTYWSRLTTFSPPSSTSATLAEEEEEEEGVDKTVLCFFCRTKPEKWRPRFSVSKTTLKTKLTFRARESTRKCFKEKKPGILAIFFSHEKNQTENRAKQRTRKESRVSKENCFGKSFFSVLCDELTK